jgi:uncharacterized membrane protein
MYRIFYALMFLPLVITLIALPILPDKVPMHYNLRNEIDRWGSKYESLILPVLVIGMGLFLKSMSKLASKKGNQNSNSNEKATILVGIATLMLFNGMTYIFLYTGYVHAKVDIAHTVDFYKIIFIFMGVMLIMIGSIMPRLKMNSIAGLRTTWSMKNETAWSLSQRFGGISLMITGLLVIIGCAFVFEEIECLLFSMGLLVLDVIVSVIYSYFAYKKTQNM